MRYLISLSCIISLFFLSTCDAGGFSPGIPAPKFKVFTLSGQKVALKSLKGKIVLLHFWASWFRQSRNEILFLKKFIQLHPQEDVQIIGISLDKNINKLKRFLRLEDVTWPQYADGRGFKNQMAKYFKISKLPCNFLIDRNGLIFARDLDIRHLNKEIEKVKNIAFIAPTKLVQKNVVKKMGNIIIPAFKTPGKKSILPELKENLLLKIKKLNSKGKYAIALKKSITALNNYRNFNKAPLYFQNGISLLSLGKLEAAKRAFLKASRLSTDYRIKSEVYLEEIKDILTGAGY
ncbi:TlpA family protein disulfide reductase [Candidatus Riflebacteria bacterium]